MRRPIYLLVLAGCAIALLGGAGCGGDEREIRAVLGDIRLAYLTEQYRRVCSLMTPAARREVGELGHLQPSGCAQDVSRNMSAAVLSPRDRAAPEIHEIAVDGVRATVTAVLGGTTLGTIRLAKHDGVWKLDQLWATTAQPPVDLR
jgi:hypothetical protein